MNVLDNPTNILSPLQFEITFECLQHLEEDLEWKVVYVGSAENSSFDQTLDEILVGPVPVGMNSFILQTPGPDPSLIPTQDLLGITVILVTCSYKEQEFARVGYYVNNEYKYAEGEIPIDGEPPKEPIDLTRVERRILAEKPRVTRFQINWTGEKEEDMPAVDERMEIVDDMKSPEKSAFAQEPSVVSPDQRMDIVVE